MSDSRMKFTFESLGGPDVRRSLLELSSLGQHLPPESLIDLAARMTPVRWDQGDIICKAGRTNADRCWILGTGSLRVDSVPDVPLINEVGSLVGELSVLGDSRRRSATVKAHGASCGLEIAYVDLERVMNDELRMALTLRAVHVLRASALVLTSMGEDDLKTLSLEAREGNPEIADPLNDITGQLPETIASMNVLLELLGRLARARRLGSLGLPK